MFLSWLSRFTDSTESQIYAWLHQAPKKPKGLVTPQARSWLQRDAARVMVLLEWKFKGYKHLTKRRRRWCYKNLEALKTDWLEYLSAHQARNQAEYLQQINQYLHEEKRVEYRAGSSFDKLCIDPREGKLVGDCNQLVALYVYLFALKYEVKNLKIKLLPEHVCLHYKGQDYETTSGQTTVYKKFTRLAPITELIAVNLQDVADKEGQHKLPAENRLLCGQLALMFTGDAKLAKQNMAAATRALFIEALEAQQWKKARGYARSLSDKKLEKLVLEHEGFAALKNESFSRARRLFSSAGSARGKLAADQAELVSVVESLEPYKTLEELRVRKAVVRRALALAKKAKRPKMVKWCEDVLRQL